MKKNTNLQLLQNVAVAFFFVLAFLASPLLSNAQDGQGPPPEIPVPLCPVNNITFTPQLGFGTINKILIGGSATNDGTICWNCYNDSNSYGRSRAFNISTNPYVSGSNVPNFSARITQDLQSSVMRFQVGQANCYNQIVWQKGLTMRTDGSVGIGTDETFGYKLAVNGGIACKNDVFLTQTDLAWPDFVFTKNYTLKPLLLLEREIDSLGHLPQMPSAAEVENKGLSLATVTTTVVQKVEELTLYTIDQQKQLEELKKRNEALEKQNQEMKARYDELLKRLDSLLKEEE